MPLRKTAGSSRAATVLAATAAGFRLRLGGDVAFRLRSSRLYACASLAPLGEHVGETVMACGLVVEHPMLRKGLCQALAEPRFMLLGEASTGELALKLALELTPDLVIMGVRLLAMDGIETTRQILSALPATKILIFSSDSAGERVEEALQAGAHGFICKRRPVNDLIRAIDEVMAGELCLSPEMSAVIVENYQRKLVGKLAPPKSILLPREKQFCG